MSEETKTYSIQLRVQRVIYEDAYIAVPVTDAITKEKDDGTFGIDPTAFVAEALRVSHDRRVEWRQESSEIQPHPIQKPMPEGRKKLDTYYDPVNEPEKAEPTGGANAG